MKRSFADILREEEDARARKTAAKLPSWAAADGLEFPTALCLEQCSSEAAARHKAAVVGKAERIADLTGGLGVDCWAFASVCDKVLHNEKDGPLSAAAERNFARLGVRNIRCTRHVVSPDSDDWLKDLRHFAPDWIFADPARRDSAGRKVFLLEDCSPDILKLLPSLWEISDNILLKLSPMADIPMLVSRLGDRLESVEVVSLAGEVKELLCVLRKSHSGEPALKVAELSDTRPFSLDFTKSEEDATPPVYASEIKAGDILLEPSSALLKAGCFNILCARYGLRKLSRFTHLYSAAEDPGIPGAFKAFRVEKTYPFGNAGFKAAGADYPKAEVTARNVPLSSDQLRAHLKTAAGGAAHIWACTACGEKMLIACSSI